MASGHCVQIGARMAGVANHNPYSGRLSDKLEGSPPYERLRTLGQMGAFAGRVAATMVRPPYPWRQVLVEISMGFRRCAIPLTLSHSVYMLGFGLVLFGGILQTLGIVEREASVMFLIWVREIATWITAMIFAGVVGSALTADLGARKIREELDALDVLGVDRLRTLIVPRVLAATIALPCLALMALLLINVVNFIVAPGYFDVSTAVFADAFYGVVDPRDIVFLTVVKNIAIGFFVGVVACYKGVTSRPGAEGVGRAVNETVVITFFGIWLFNVFYNLGFFTLFPEVSTFKG